MEKQGDYEIYEWHDLFDEFIFYGHTPYLGGARAWARASYNYDHRPSFVYSRKSNKVVGRFPKEPDKQTLAAEALALEKRNTVEIGPPPRMPRSVQKILGMPDPFYDKEPKS